MEDITIVPSERCHIAEIIALLSHDREDNYVSWKTQIWDWQYYRNPYGFNQNPTLVLLKNGVIVGSCSFFYCKVKFLEQELTAIFGWDFIVAKACRGMGYGTMLALRRQEQASMTLHFGISNLSFNIHQRNGGSVNNEIGEFFFVNKIRTFRDLFKFSIGVVNRFHACFVKKTEITYKVSILSNLPEKNIVDSIWDRVKNGYEKIVVRNYDYLKWKYQDHPLGIYKYIVVEEGSCVAIAIFRFDSSHSRLVDYLGPSDAYLLKKMIVKTFKEECHSALKLSCVVTDYQFKKALRGSGFYKYKRQPRFCVSSSETLEDNLSNGWFIMAGDSDDDLLVAAKKKVVADER